MVKQIKATRTRTDVMVTLHKATCDGIFQNVYQDFPNIVFFRISVL